MRPPPKNYVCLSDDFGAFVLVITCSKCGHCRQANPAVLARLVGWNCTLTAISERMRCSKCGDKQVRVEGKEPPRRRWAVNINRD